MSIIDPCKIRPYGDHVLVRRDDFDERTRGGLIVPDVAKTAAEGSRQQLKRGRGIVLAVGPGARKMKRVDLGYYETNGVRATREVPTDEREPLDVKPGDRVVFSIFANTGDLDELGYPEHRDLTLLRADEILGVLGGRP